MEIKVLGSVSPYCKDNHNCPGFLVEQEGQKILLDCGNGITRLMNLPDDLKNLKVIISHLHKDHYDDLPSLQNAAYVYHKLGLLDSKFNIYLPKTILPTDYDPTNFDETYYDYKLITSSKNTYSNIYNYDDHCNIRLPGMKISFVPNYHSIKTYSTKIETPDLKVVYTSDLGYNSAKNLIDFAKNADLLICESTFIRKHQNYNEYHLHAFESANIARYANVKKLLLTHFWPETDKLEYLEEAKSFFENTEVAEEGKILTLKGGI